MISDQNFTEHNRRPVIDLHMHSTASDGLLNPTQLVECARQNGIQIMALTDHDTVAGLKEATSAASKCGIRLINGVELSVTWEKKTLHILGLNIDPGHRTLSEGLLATQQCRQTRAVKIGKRLARVGVPNAFEGASKFAANGLVTRPHFARYLVEQGFAKNTQEAFKRYLTGNKPGNVATQWVAMTESIAWIKAAGGTAVLAHPLRYQLTSSWLRRVLEAFKSAGGGGIEVVCGKNSESDVDTSSGYARRYDLKGSVGSDYHGSSPLHCRFGALPALPKGITPVWGTFFS